MLSPIYEWDEIEHVFRDLVVYPIIYLHECTRATTQMKVILTHDVFVESIWDIVLIHQVVF